MFFHSIKISCMIHGEAGKWLSHARATDTHISGRTHSNLRLPSFPHRAGKKLWYLAVRSAGRILKDAGEMLGWHSHTEGCPPPGCPGNGPGHLEWGRQESTWLGCFKLPEVKCSFSHCQPAQNLFDVLYSRAAAGDDEELGEITPSLDVSIRALSVSISWNQEPKPPAWNFTGFKIKFFSVVQSLSDTRTSLFWEQFMWKRPGVLIHSSSV